MLTLALSLGGMIGVGIGQSKPIELSFSKLLVATGRGLGPSEVATASLGKRVRIEGFMALIENPPLGGFWLCPNQVFQDESGGGTGDLPPNAVFVVVRGAGKKPIAHLAGRLAVSGILSIKSEAPRFVLTLDSERDVALTKSKGARS
jgi:hypothetical protein